RDLRLFRNGSLVKVWRGDLLKGKTSETFTISVPVIAGENLFTAYAFNRDNVKSRDTILAIKGHRSLSRTGTAYILAIGINQYENQQYNLQYAVADAQLFGRGVTGQQMRIAKY